MSNIRPNLSEFQEPEPGTQLEVGLGAFGRNILWSLLLAAIVGVVVGAAPLLVISRADPPAKPGFLDQDAERIADNPVLRAWIGLKHIWLKPHRLPDFSPLTYTTFLIEARVWGTARPNSATGFRTGNLLIHIAAALALWHLLARLELPGSWTAATLFAVHPATIATAAWPSQRPILLGTLFGLLTLIVLFRAIGLNPRPEQAHRLFRLPDGSFALWALVGVLTMLTIASSPAIAAVLGPVALVIVWWDRGRLRREDFIQLLPLLIATLLIAATALWLSLRQGGGDFALPQCPWWYRPIAIVQQLAFYALMSLLPLRPMFAYEPLGVFGIGAIASLAAAAALVAGAVWALFNYGRGALAAIVLFVVILLPLLIWVESKELYGGWTGIQRLYPAVAVLVAAVVCSIAGARWALIRRDAAFGLAAIAIALVSLGGVIEATKRTSQQRLWDDVIAKNSQSVVAMVSLADAAIGEQSFARAEQLLTSATTVRPGDVLPLIKLGELEEARHQPERAMFNYLKALKIEGENYAANFGLARTLAARQASTEALAQYQKVLRLQDGDPVIHNNIGLIHAERGETDRAEAEYRTALRLDPRCTAARINLANLMYQRGDVDAAARELTVVLDIDRDNFQAFMNAGAMLGQMRQFEKAAILFRRAIMLDNDMPAAYANLANALLGEEMNPNRSRSERISLLSEAAHMFEKAAEFDPRNPEYRSRAQAVRRQHEALSAQPQ